MLSQLYTCEKWKLSLLKILKLRIYYERENLWGSKTRMNNYNRKFVRWKPVGGRDADPAERQTRFSISKTWLTLVKVSFVKKWPKQNPVEICVTGGLSYSWCELFSLGLWIAVFFEWGFSIVVIFYLRCAQIYISAVRFSLFGSNELSEILSKYPKSWPVYEFGSGVFLVFAITVRSALCWGISSFLDWNMHHPTLIVIT